MAGFLSFLVALGVTMLLIPPLIRVARQLKFVDIPDARKVHSVAMPRVGGIAMIVGAVVSIIFALQLGTETIAFLLGSAVVLAFGAWDDRGDLDYRLKFLGQLLAALVVIVFGNVLIERVPLYDGVLPLVLSVPLTVFALLAITNAINLSDGLDGLAGGVTLLTLGTIAVMAQLGGGRDVLIMSVAVMGSIFGFLRFNTHPAFVFMGDTGSQFLGFSVGVLSILLTQRVESSLSTAMPLLVLGLPLLDTLMVMIQRIRAGRSPFSPDRNHIHHKLLGLGFDHYEAVSIIYLLQAFLVSVGFALRYQYDTVVLGIYLLICVATYALFRWAAAAGWRFQGRATGAKSALSERVRRLREGGWIERWSQIYVAFSIFGYLWFAAVHPEGVSRDIGFLAAGLLLLYIPMYWSHRGQPWANAERAGLYIASVLAVYLMFATPREGPAQDRLEEIFFTALALAVITGIHFARKVRFELTPLDFLVLFMALAFPRFPNVVSPSLSLGLALAEVFVLFYGVELIINRSTGRWNVMRLALIGMLAVVVARGVILG